MTLRAGNTLGLSTLQKPESRVSTGAPKHLIHTGLMSWLIKETIVETQSTAMDSGVIRQMPTNDGSTAQYHIASYITQME